MGTKLVRKLTPYQAIPIHTKNLSLYSVSDLYHVGPLIEGLREWNLHGSANDLQHWANRMHDHIDDEQFALPLGIVDWEAIDEEFKVVYE